MLSSKVRKIVLVVLILAPFAMKAQTTRTTRKKGEFYFSWGYNKEWYTRSNLKISQPELGNDYTFRRVTAHDHPGWDEGLLSKAITIPQYNYRIGYFFNDKHDLGIEINFDHTKYIITDGKDVNVKGRLNGRSVDTTVNFSEGNGFFYYLNNGANFLLINIVKRWHWYANQSNSIKIDALGKFGIGPVIPHVENSFFNQKNEPHFQIGGWNTGIEGALRSTFFKHVYLEFAGKLDYARYSGLRIYKGHARQAFGTAEIILNLGITL